MLIDVSAASPPAGDPARDSVMAARRRAAAAIGVSVAILCAEEPAALAPDALERENDARRADADAAPDRLRWYAAVDPSNADRARTAIGRHAAAGAAGIELAGRVFTDAALDAVALECARLQLPVRVPPSDAAAALAARHPQTVFILASIGDGGRWYAPLTAVARSDNVVIDVSGRVAERGLFDAVIAEVGAGRVLWGTGAAMETGLAHLRALVVIAPGEDAAEKIRWRNAARLFTIAPGSPP